MQQSYPIPRSERPRSSDPEEFRPTPRVKSHAANRKDPRVEVTVVQLIFCALALLGVFGLKFLGGDFYEAVKERYVSLACDRTSVRQVVETWVNLPAQESDFASAAIGGSDENQEPYTENYQEVAEEIEKSQSNIHQLTLPLQGTLTSPFAQRVHPITGKTAMHGGVDIAAPAGSEIVAVADGVVRRAHEDGRSGRYLIVDHNESLSTMYAHCQELLVAEGDSVKRGQTIGLVGSTGLSTGPHLHFEIRLNGVKLNPEWLLDFTADS